MSRIGVRTNRGLLDRQELSRSGYLVVSTVHNKLKEEQGGHRTSRMSVIGCRNSRVGIERAG
jgi:hypothetical protein